MATQIQISSITGTSPYNVYVCDVYGSNCVFVNTIFTTVPPTVTITLPPQFDYAPSVMIKIIDADGCEISNIEECVIPTPTLTATPTITPSITPTATQGPPVPPAPTPTPTTTPTLTNTPPPTPSYIPQCFAYIFPEPKDSTSSIDLGTYMFNNGATLFYGYANSGVPGVGPTYSSDLDLYAHYPGFVLGGLGNFITPVSTIKSDIRQLSGAGTDSFGCTQNQYTFGTIEIDTTMVDVNTQYFYSIWIPLSCVGGSMINMTVDAGTAPCAADIFNDAIPEPVHASSGNVVVTSGAAIPAGTYRVLWIDPNLNQPSLPPPPLTNSIFIKGEFKT